MLILESEERREKERERNINVKEKHPSVASPRASTGDRTCNPGMCPDQESNPQPFFGLRDDTPTE